MNDDKWWVVINEDTCRMSKYNIVSSVSNATTAVELTNGTRSPNATPSSYQPS